MLEQAIRKVAQEVRLLGQARESAAKLLRSQSAAIALPSFDFLEPKLTLTVEKAPQTTKLLAVDGGILGEELHSLDLFVAKACAVMFHYKDGAVQGCDYYPSPFPPYEYTAEHSLQTHEFNWYKNLARINCELDCTLGAIKTLSPDAVFLDGSIVPQVGDKPSHDSGAYPQYDKALEKWKEIYELCDERGTALLGIIKDSRGRRFIDLLLASVPALAPYATALAKTNDTTFLHSLLQPGERTAAFKYSGDASENTVLRDVGEWSKKVASFYVKPVEFDRPLRVDFLLGGDAKKIGQHASLVRSLSSDNQSYAYPGILIEADLRAALEPQEMEAAKAMLASELGLQPELFALRRNSRPFR